MKVAVGLVLYVGVTIGGLPYLRDNIGSAAICGCCEYYNSGVPSKTAAAWCKSGGYFDFASAANAGRTAKVFYHCAGNVSHPAIVMGHGWPTSSFDFLPLSNLLEDTYQICTVDYVGFGFSDKPVDWIYQIAEHAEVIERFVTDIAKLKSFVYLTHDEGDSVGLQLLKGYQQGIKSFTITHHIMLDGSIYLPKADLKPFQKALLNNITGPEIQKKLSGAVLANLLKIGVFSPPSSCDAQELATVFEYQNGTHIMHNTIQYLVERHEHEVEWLEVLGRSTIPTTLIWGGKDPVAVLAVADYVWANYLANRTQHGGGPATYHKIPEANHYLQIDHASEVAELVRNATSSYQTSTPLEIMV